MNTDRIIEETLLDIARNRARNGASFCPSEAARSIAPGDWRHLMPVVRKVAGRLQRDGRLHVTQNGVAVDALLAEGPIRISKPTH